MRKIYQKYFYIPEQGEGVMREKVFFARFILSVITIIACMIAMGYNAYAYFTVNTASNRNIIESARYAFDRTADTIFVVSTDGSVSAGASDGEYRLEVGTYDFVLASNADDITGYGRIDVLRGEERTSFYTRRIVQGEPCTVRLMTEVAVDILITACWGTYSSPENVMNEYGNESGKTPQMIKVFADLQAEKVLWENPMVSVESDEISIDDEKESMEDIQEQQEEVSEQIEGEV